VTSESIIIECDLPDSPEKVWRALTEQNLLAAWLMPNDMQPEAGSRFRFVPADEEGRAKPIDCEVLQAVPNQVLSWHQSEQAAAHASVESVVTIVLAATPDGGTRLRLVHDGFVQVSTREPRGRGDMTCLLRRAA
jgi:uncharacterized protein YndB with AHSA1/START domain